MSKWFVGQRVRLVKTLRFHEFRDSETTITALNVLGQAAEDTFIGHRINLINPDTHRQFVAQEWQLEPLYNGHEKIEWEEMKDLWHPSNIEEVVQVS